MNGTLSGNITVLIALFLFGMLYNAAVSWAKPRGYLEPYTSLWVAIGVSVTLGAAGAIIGWQAAAWLLACFAASGIPMIVGDAARYVQSVQREKEALRKEVTEKADDPTQTLAE